MRRLFAHRAIVMHKLFVASLALCEKHSDMSLCMSVIVR